MRFMQNYTLDNRADIKSIALREDEEWLIRMIA
jgi:hypothetical protein